jgi:hypothetical protein
LVGAVLGGLGAGAVYGVARRLVGGSTSVALVAGLLYACWPAGIAVASVTGTDMPGAVLVLAAAYGLLRFADTRPTRAAILLGILTGLAAYIRAIVIPLAALSVFVFRVTGRPWRASLRSAALACIVALLVLAPWAVRNRVRYGETFLTDSHGGLTALVGANPNTLGCYSRSLNRIFHDVTGYTLLAEPHREADRAALALAREWTFFDPYFTLGLLASKTERLLVHERALLYWPLFRAGVLPEPQRAFFAGHQHFIEALADGFYLTVMALALVGIGVSLSRKRWLALSLLPQAAALAVLYAVLFSEPRYRIPIFMLLIPLAAIAIDFFVGFARDARGRVLSSNTKRDMALGLGLAIAVFALAPAVAWAGHLLRQRHAWAVSECSVEGRTRPCAWRSVGAVPVLGVYSGVGIELGNPAQSAGAAQTELSLAAGDYVVSGTVDVLPVPSGNPVVDGTAIVRAWPVDEGTDTRTTSAMADGRGVVAEARVPLADIAQASLEGRSLPWTTRLHHGGGRLVLRVQTEGATLNAQQPERLWLSDLRIDRVAD